MRIILVPMVCGSLLLASCAQKNNDGRNGGGAVKIRIATPSNPIGSQKMVAMAALPSDRKACYAVNVTGLNIAVAPGAGCAPGLGSVGGFVQAGGELNVAVPKGTSRRVELYLYLMAPGDNGPCPAIGNPMAESRLGSTYLLGATENVTLAKDEEEVTIQASFPGVTQHLPRQLSMSTACISAADASMPSAVAGGLPGYYQSLAAGTVSNGTVSVRARIGRTVSGTTASGGNASVSSF
jgi:hypothetical protein